MNDRFSVLTLCKGNVHRSRSRRHFCPVGGLVPTGISLKPYPCQRRLLRAGWARPWVTAFLRSPARSARMGLRTGPPRSTMHSFRAQTSCSSRVVANWTRCSIGRLPRCARPSRSAKRGVIAGGIQAAPPASARDLRRVVERLADLRAGAASEAEDDIIDPKDTGTRLTSRWCRRRSAFAQLAAPLFGMPRADLVAYLAAAEDPSPLLGPTGGALLSE